MKRIAAFLSFIILFVACEKKPDYKKPMNKSIGNKIVNNPDHKEIGDSIISEYDYFIKVIRIKDGDTFFGLTRDNIEIEFRVHGIDAPEKKQAFGTESKEKLSDLIHNKRVGIKVQTKRDKYGRPVVWVYTPEGKDVSAEMLKAGMAWHYKKYDDSEYYSRLEVEARARNKGLWVDDNPTAPWEYRKP